MCYLNSETRRSKPKDFVANQGVTYFEVPQVCCFPLSDTRLTETAMIVIVIYASKQKHTAKIYQRRENSIVKLQ